MKTSIEHNGPLTLLDKLLQLITNPKKLRNQLSKPGFKYWILITLCISAIFAFFSDGDFSFLLTLATLLRTLGFGTIVLKLASQNATSGLSLASFVCYVFVLAGRLSSTLFKQEYLPFDSSGDWFYQVCEILSLLMCLYICTRLKHSREDILPATILIVPCAAIALFAHPTLNSNTITDCAWGFAMYLESVALIPQILLLKKRKGDVEVFSSHFIAASGTSQLFSMIFWMFSFKELNIVYAAASFNLFARFSGYLVLLAKIAECVFVADFFYYYVKSAILGTPFSLPI
mmetsp:Transcript_5319/g.9755  ORF Transcript_5319/g.9755 Transcript_5319/m.9755 type:complete len:288 (-) Transcript_5319:38-901(-)